MRHHRSVRALITIIAAGLLSVPAWGQRQAIVGRDVSSLDRLFRNGTAQLHGRVTVGGKPVPGAIVRLQDLRTGIPVASAQSGDDGIFSFENLEPGRYVLTTYLGVRQVQDEISVTALQSDVEVRFPSEAPADGSPVVSAAQLGVPAKARNELQDARRALSKRDIAKAVRKIADALKIAPKFAEALTLRAALALSSGNLSGAEDDLDKAIRDDPSYPDAYFMMGATYNEMRRYQDAQRTVEQGLRLNPAAWQGHVELGRALLGSGNAAGALKAFDRALGSTPPTFADIHLLRGSALLRLQRDSEGAQEFETYLRQQPDGPSAAQARTVLAELREKSGGGGGQR